MASCSAGQRKLITVKVSRGKKKSCKKEKYIYVGINIKGTFDTRANDST